MQLSAGEEPPRLEGEKLKSQANGGKHKRDAGDPSGQAEATRERESPWQNLLTGLNVISALLTFVTAVFAWQLLKTDAARVLVCIDIIIFVSVYASLFFLLKKGKPALESVVNTLLISVFCVMVVVTYFVNSLPGTAPQPAPQPTVTVTTIETTTASASPASPASTGSQSGSQKGRLLGSYSFELDADYSVPLSSTKPTESQYANPNNGDLLFTWDDDNFEFEVTTNSSSYNHLVALPPGSQLSYTACTTPKTFANQVVAAIGVEFCMLEPGKVVGVRVAALHNYSWDAILNVTVWQRGLCLARRPARDSRAAGVAIRAAAMARG